MIEDTFDDVVTFAPFTLPTRPMGGMDAATECNSSSLIEYSDLCLREDPPDDCYPSVKVRKHLMPFKFQL